ncbi:MAG: TonB-dependent receptor domain-containing protein [Verrucomicrobiota bacterium]
MRPPVLALARLLACLGGLLPAFAAAAIVRVDVPAQPAAAALLEFSRQSGIEVLFPHDELQGATTAGVRGSFEPGEALDRLLRDTGFAARQNQPGKFVVTRTAARTGAIEGRLLAPGGGPAAGVTVALAGTALRAVTNGDGRFVFPDVPPGRHRLLAGGGGFRPMQRPDVRVEAGRTSRLETLRLEPSGEITELEPYLVEGRGDRLPIGEAVGAPPRRAAGNLDLPRTTDNALPFAIFTREQIARSGVAQLNEFLQRELLDGDASTPPPDQNGNRPGFVTGNSNLNLRGYGTGETVVLVNGRRLPETFTDVPGQLGLPDVNLVPLSLVQQVEVLPVSASALYSGNAVGGVVNILLQPGGDGTEVRTTHTNAFGFDAPQSSLSFSHGRSLRDGRLRLRLNATFTRTEPAIESELGHQRRRLASLDPGLAPRDTPNLASASGAPLFGPGTAAFASVAPGADGRGGIAAFAGRQGLRSNGLYDLPGGIAASINSRDYPYGRRQRRAAWFGSVAYDLAPWLQLGLDATHARTVVNRGYDVFTGDLTLSASSPLNPFGQDLAIALHESAPALGRDYSEARLESTSAVLGALVRLPRDWQLMLDVQYARNVARYRGLVGADADRWQQLADAGLYQPLRDTQVHGPPREFYDRALVYYGGPGRFVTLGDYTTLEGAARLTHEALVLPTGESTVNLGADYRLRDLAPYTEEPRFADGTPAAEIIRWTGRTLEQISVFGELQAPLLPAARLPRWLERVETDLAARYTVSADSRESNVAPTFGLKLDFAGGFSFRASYTTSNRLPAPLMSRPLAQGSGGGSTADTVRIFDPLRHEHYETEARVAINPHIRPESAATQTAGLAWQRGKTHRFRASLDFADTTKTDEFVPLDPQDVLNLEALFPDRVQRDTPATGEPPRVTTVLTGTINVARRHSQNWSTAFEYAWRECLGGTLELRGRWMWFQRYDRQIYPNSPEVDELAAPDGRIAGLLRHRLAFGANWTGPRHGFGLDAHYFGERILPAAEWAGQGSDRIAPYWQLDAYVQTDLSRWLPWENDRHRLQGQLRVNNLSGFDFPKYANDASGSGVQPYGDWRGRTYSLSLTATF